MERELNVLVINPKDTQGKLAQSLEETYSKDLEVCGLKIRF